jgi:hypothetical protein
MDSAFMARLEPTSDHSVTVWDQPRANPGAQIIGTVNAGSHGVEAFRPHYSLAERSAARIPGSGEFANVLAGVQALIADYDSGAGA